MPELADGTLITVTVGNGGLTPSAWALWRSGWHSMPPYDGRVSGRDVCLLRRGVASSEAEMFCPLEGSCATLERVGDVGCSRGVSTGTLERGGDRPAGSRGMRMGPTLGFFESFPFFRMGSGPWAFVTQSLNVCVRFS